VTENYIFGGVKDCTVFILIGISHFLIFNPLLGSRYIRDCLYIRIITVYQLIFSFSKGVVILEGDFIGKKAMESFADEYLRTNNFRVFWIDKC